VSKKNKKYTDIYFSKNLINKINNSLHTVGHLILDKIHRR